GEILPRREACGEVARAGFRRRTESEALEMRQRERAAPRSGACRRHVAERVGTGIAIAFGIRRGTDANRIHDENEAANHRTSCTLMMRASRRVEQPAARKPLDARQRTRQTRLSCCISVSASGMTALWLWEV